MEEIILNEPGKQLANAICTDKFNKQLLTTVLFVLLLYCFTTTVRCQSVIIEKGSVNKYLSGNDTISSCRITIKNSTARNYLLWLSDYDKSKSFKNYFFRQIGDFSLFNIIDEYSGGSMTIIDIDLFHVLYKTFYKVILANDSFSIYVQCKNCDIIKKVQLVTNQICTDDLSQMNTNGDSNWTWQHASQIASNRLMNTNGGSNWTVGRDFEMLSYKSDYIILSY